MPAKQNQQTRLNGMPPILVSAGTAQRLLDVGRAKLWRLAEAGQIRAVQIGPRRMVVYASLQALVADEPQQHPEVAA